MDSKDLIKKVGRDRKSHGYAKDPMELGQQQLEQTEGNTNLEATVIENGGKIYMPAQFNSMRELLTAIETALPGNNFLYKWMQNKVGASQRRKWSSSSGGETCGYKKNRGRHN